jgi:general secretion pathway protein J
MAYFGSIDGVSEGSWQEEWLDIDFLPRLVKINIKLENEIFWPEMIIDLKITGLTNNADIRIDNINNPGNTDNAENSDQPEVVQ